jgi:MAM domain, meprin/A5/mu/Secretion system C-terminal sorting domain/PKD domain
MQNGLILVAMIRKITLLVAAFGSLFFLQQAYSQCVSTYPHTQDFESFDSLQTSESCDAGVRGDSAGGWYQDQSDQGEWRADTAGTASTGTGPGSTATTSGDGTGTDYVPGTTAGVYLYTEATATTTCDGANVSLLSPCFDFSASGTYYQLKFAYHMFGAGMGSLNVDVYDGTNWKNAVWSLKGSQDTNWHEASVGLANYNGTSIQIRIRAVMGPSFQSDCAIDAISVGTYTPPDYDIALTDLSLDPTEYYFKPIQHVSPITFSGKVQNIGLKTATGVKLRYESQNSSDSVSIGSVASFATDSADFGSTFTPSGLSDSVLTFRATLNENDGDTANNKKDLNLHLTDKVYSREDGSFTGGIGYNTGGGQIGNMFELLVDDTLISVSFFLNAPASGDSMKVHLYEYGSAPGTLITTTNFIVASGSEEWHDLKFNCPQILSAGKYFVAVEQIVANSNMSLGYSFNCYTRNSSYYGNGSTWTELGAGGFNACLLVRMNLGEIARPKVTITAVDTLCQKQVSFAKGSGALTYVWGPRTNVVSPNTLNTNFLGDTSFVLTLTGTDACGYTHTAYQPIHIKNNPNATTSSDTVVCKNESVTLSVVTNNNYKWVGGTANGNYTVKPTKSTTYRVEVDSSNGCVKEFTVDVNVSIPTPFTSNDTTVCEAQTVNLMASGGKSYQWMGGPATSTYSVNPRKNTQYIVSVFDALGCSENDTVNVTITPGPSIETSNDTAICFGQQITMRASGAKSYEWTGGPSTAEYATRPLVTKSYFVKGTAADGCYLMDSVHVEVAPIPKVDVLDDTTICEGTSLTINANTTYQVTFKWNTGDTTQLISVSPTETTKYKVLVENATGCSAEDSVMLDVDPLPKVSVSYVLNKRDVTFTNNSLFGDSHSWEFGDGDTGTNKNEFHKYAIDGDYTVKYTVTNECGSDDTTFNIKIQNLGLEPMIFEAFSLTPNPTNGTSILSFTNGDLGECQLSVYDLSGKQVKKWTAVKSSNEFSTTVSIADLSNGVYMLNIEMGNYVATKRIVLNR